MDLVLNFLDRKLGLALVDAFWNDMGELIFILNDDAEIEEYAAITNVLFYAYGLTQEYFTVTLYNNHEWVLKKIELINQ